METPLPSLPRHHGHHKVAASIFVGLLILGAAIVLAAELMKPPRYEYHAAGSSNQYILFDSDTGKSAVVDVGQAAPLDALK